jgi:hypothetical protein
LSAEEQRTVGRPWLGRPDWASGRISSNIRANVRGAWTFALLWNIVSAPVLIFIPRELARKPIAAVGFLFPIVGVGLLGWAVLLTMRWRRFGPSWFEMRPIPASPGGSCTGTIHTRLDRQAGASLVVSIRLTCLQRTISGSARNRNVRETIVWRDEYEIAADRLAFTPVGTSIPVQFSIPSDAFETTTIDSSPGVLWALAADAELPGVDLREDFDVPVYRTSDTTASTGPPVAAAFTPPPEPVTIERLAAAGITVRPTPDGTEYHFAPGRNVGFAAGTTAFLLLWTGSLWLQWYLSAPWIFLVLTGLFELVMIAIVTDLWCGSTTVIVGANDIRRRRSTLGLGRWESIPSSRIRDLRPQITMQSTGRSGTPFYELRATLDGGRRVAFGDAIRNKRHAEWLTDRMTREARVGAQPPAGLR